MILSSDKSSERNLSSFFDMKKPRRMEHLQSEEPFSSDPYFTTNGEAVSAGQALSGSEISYHLDFSFSQLQKICQTNIRK